MRISLFFFSFLIIFTSSCSRINSGNQNNKLDLKNTSWYFTSYYGAGKTAISLEKNYLLEFKEKALNIQWDRNSCKNTYSYKAGKLKFLQSFACTKICCDSKEAQALQKAVEAGKIIVEKQDENTLKLKTSSKEIPVIFLSKEAPLQLNLVGTSWVISKKENLTNNTFNIPKGKYPVNFSEDQVDIQLNVNSCTQSLRYEGLSFKVEPNSGACTEACCDSEEAAQYSSIITNGMKFKLVDEKLVLEDKFSRYTLSPFKVEEFNAVNIEDLIGTSWKSIDMTDKEANLVLNSATKYYIAIEKGRFSVKLPVNSCKCSYESEKNILILPNSNMSCTKKCCDAKEDLAYLAHFKGRLKAEIKGDILQLSNNLVALRFKKQ